MIRISRKTGDLLTTIALIAAVIFFFIETFSLAPSPVRGYPGAAFLPRLILVYAMIFLSVLLIQIFMRAPADPATDAGGFDFEVTDYVVTIAAISWFILGLSYFGFEVTSFTLIAALLIRRIGQSARSGAVRLRERRIHRCSCFEARTSRGCRRRYALPR